MARLGFLGGLAQGYINESNLAEARARADREEARRDQEASLRTRILTNKLNDEDSVRADARGEREALAKAAEIPDNAVNGFSTGAPGSRVFTQDKAAAQAFADQDAFINEAPATVAPSTGGSRAGVPSIGPVGLRTAGDPRLDSYAARERFWSTRDPVRANAIADEAAKFKQAKYDAGRQHILQTGFDMIAAGDFAGLTKAYNDHYKDGRFASFESDGAGGGVIVQKDSAGKVIGSLPFKGRDDLLLAYQDLIYPEKRAEAVAASRSKAAAEANKVIPLAHGAVLTKGGEVIARNDAGYASSGGSGRGAAATEEQSSAFDPTVGFDLKSAQSSATAMVDDQIKNGILQATPQQRASLIVSNIDAMRNTWIRSRTQEARAAAFLSEARKAATPAQIEAVRAEARKRKFTDAEMTALDPRFAPAPSPTSAAGKVNAQFAARGNPFMPPVPVAKP